MTINVSSKFKELILGANSFESIFDGGRIVIFTGPQPASADYPIQGTPIADVTVNGSLWTPNGSAAGLHFTRDGVWASNDIAQAWVLTGSADGTAGWFRLFGPALDTGDYSFNAPRIDGSVGVSGSVDFKLPTTAITVGYTIPVQQFLFSFPPILGG